MTIAEHPWREVALGDAEYAQILELLGREPYPVELGMFGAMWSEHCGYKHSRPLLKTLPTEAPWVLQGPGENAGAVDLGNGLAAVFKVESHNHPSAVEPYEGAATGVGGIVRDIFTMGARPVAILDALALRHARQRPQPVPVRPCRRWHWRLRKLPGYPHGRRRDRVRRKLQRQPNRQCDVRRAGRRRWHRPGQGERNRQHHRHDRRRNRPRRVCTAPRSPRSTIPRRRTAAWSRSAIRSSKSS